MKSAKTGRPNIPDRIPAWARILKHPALLKTMKRDVAREDTPEILYCSRQICHGAASVAGSLRDLKNTLITSVDRHELYRASCLERICQQEGQLIFLRDILQFAGFEGLFSQVCIARLSATRVYLDSARSELVKGGDVNGAEAAVSLVSMAIADLEELVAVSSLYITQPVTDAEFERDALKVVLRICGRFPQLTRELLKRSKRATTFLLEDEYDLQHLLLSVLRLHFDDIRCEEPTPAYAGGGSRMDFLLMPMGIVVETKKTRPDLKERSIADQLIIDAERYAKHPDCRHLVCFVFDPDLLIRNPKGIERDLMREERTLPVSVVVSPQGK